MKKILSILLAAAMLLTLGLPALAEEEVANYDHLVMPISELGEETYVVQGEDVKGAMDGSVVILHSNDVHGAIDGYAKMATLKEMYTLMGAEVIVVDAGDFIQGETSVSVSQGETAVELMNLVGYDVAAPGNHEFDYGFDNLKKLAGEADFPILAANVFYEGAPAFGTNTVIEAGGLKIGFFGLDTPETASKAHPAKIQGVSFAGGEEMYAIAQAQVQELREAGADVVVCLGHLGIDEETAATANRSIDLLEKVTGIDVFIDGHSHSTQEDIAAKIGDTRTVGEAVLTSTGTKFANIGVVTIGKDGITTECVATENVGVAEDSPIAARAAEIRADIETIYGAKFAETEVTLDGNKAPGVRTGETNLGDLIADALLWYATKDGALQVPVENTIAITNGGGIRASIEAGDITRNDINTVLPFGNTVAVVYVDWETLLEVLEASTFCTPEAVGAFPQVAGIQFTVDTTVPYAQGGQYGETTYFGPASIDRVRFDSVRVNGEPLDEYATYAVVTNDFLAAGGDTYYALSVSDTIVDTGTPMDEAVMDYITTQLDGVITQAQYGAAQGRINVVEKAPMWYDAAVEAVTERGLMVGTDNGFEPDATVTRATVFQTLYNLEGKPPVEAPTGHLLQLNEAAEGVSGHWWTDAARWAYQTGLTTGTGEGFQGDREVMRSELVVILDRYAQYKGADRSAGDNVELLAAYADAELLTTWSVDAFRWAVGAGVISGKTTEAGTILAPGHTATRAELAQILVNFTDFFTPSAQ